MEISVSTLMMERAKLAYLKSLYSESPLTNKPFAEDRALRAALSSAFEGQVMDWKTIDSAPRDGRTMILLLTPNRWPQVAWSNTWWIGGFSVECKPTHWMPLEPLPEPPK